MKPMLAQTGSEPWLDEIEPDKDWVVTRKWDGARLIFDINNEGNKLLTRSGRNVISTFPDFQRHFPKLDGTVLDGEGITSTEYLGDVQSLIHTKGVGKGLILVTFDCLKYQGKNIEGLPGNERRPYLEVCYEALKNANMPVRLELLIRKRKRGFYQNGLKKGWEGVMAKDMLAPYSPGKRTYAWMKVKPRNTYDFIITGFVEGQGKYRGTVGAIIYSAYYQGKLTEVGTSSGMTDPERDEMWTNPRKFVGKVAEFEALETTRRGIMRHPAYVKLRPDLSPGIIRLETYLNK